QDGQPEQVEHGEVHEKVDEPDRAELRELLADRVPLLRQELAPRLTDQVHSATLDALGHHRVITSRWEGRGRNRNIAANATPRDAPATGLARPDRRLPSSYGCP